MRASKFKLRGFALFGVIFFIRLLMSNFSLLNFIKIIVEWISRACFSGAKLVHGACLKVVPRWLLPKSPPLQVVFSQ